jgi:heme oxygenase (mycobilin-producing)
MFVAVSRFTVANSMRREIRDAFVQRPHLVDEASGFIRMEVLNAEDNQDEFCLLTYWADESSFRHWHLKHRHESHAAIPKGLKIVPGSAQLRFFEHVCD